ncbi:MAG: M1 family metallopeptidase [Anaerolineales bacterium]
MKKIMLWTMILSLTLTACQLRLYPAPEATPGASPPETQPAPDKSENPFSSYPSVFKSGLIPAHQHWVTDLASATRYNIHFVLTDELNRISGSQEVIYTNNEEVALEEVQFRLLPNVLSGEMQVTNVKRNGQVVEPKYALRNSLMRVPLEQALQPGQSVNIAIEFSLRVPTQLESNYGILAYYDGVLALAHAYPMVAVYDEEGWDAEIPPDQGDPTYHDASFYIVTVDAPDDLVLVGSGIEVQRENNGGRQKVMFAAGPARDFYLAASAAYQVLTQNAEGVTVNSYYRGDGKEGAQAALDFTLDTLRVFGARYTPYPYSEYDIVPTPTYALGIEYPGVVAITENLYDMQAASYGMPNRALMESVVVHEGAHQWFYNMIGNDQLEEPWLDESLSQFVTWQYYEDLYGPGGGEGFAASLHGRWQRVELAEIPIGQHVGSYEGPEYSAIVYGRGAFFFDELRTLMGAETFDAFMQDYAEAHTWGIASGESLKLLAEAHCQCKLDKLYEAWVQ